MPRRRHVDVDGLRQKSPAHPAGGGRRLRHGDAAGSHCDRGLRRPDRSDQYRRNPPPCRRRAGKQLPNEGERLKVGELLFVIDQQPYIAALSQAKAALAQSQAALVQSQRDLGRAKSLSEIDAVSQQELDAAVAKNDANLASVDASRAGSGLPS